MDLNLLLSTGAQIEVLQAFPFAALAGLAGPALKAAAPGLASGLVAGLMGDPNKGAAKKAYKFGKKQYNRELENYRQDKTDDRRYNKVLLNRDRDYYEDQISSDRDYTEKLTAKDRAYAARLVENDRDYMEARLNKDRGYMENARQLDKKRFIQTQKNKQAWSDAAAEKTAESRGINFQQLRDDAIAAGFNPLTAMSMAHAYSTETDYTDKRQTWDADGSYRVGGAGYTSGAGAGGAASTPAIAGAGGAPMAPGAPSAGFQSSGAGFQSQSGPSLSAGSFIAEAVGRGVDTFFNKPDDGSADADYRNIAGQVQAGITERAWADQTPRDFGYNLAHVQPFKPRVGVLNPVLGASPSDDLVNPSKNPLKIGGFDAPPSGVNSDASAFEERYGDVAGSLYGLGTAIYDGINWANSSDWNKKSRDWLKIPVGTPTYSRTGTTPRGPRIPFRGIAFNH